MLLCFAAKPLPAIALNTSRGKIGTRLIIYNCFTQVKSPYIVSRATGVYYICIEWMETAAEWETGNQEGGGALERDMGTKERVGLRSNGDQQVGKFRQTPLPPPPPPPPFSVPTNNHTER